MAYTINERRAGFVGFLVCLGYSLFICIQLGLYSASEFDYGDPGNWTVFFLSWLLACSIVTMILLYCRILNVSDGLCGLLFAPILYLVTFIWLWIAGGKLIYYGFLLPATPLQWHVFVWFWGVLILISLSIIYNIPRAVYNVCRENFPSFVSNCALCCSLHSQKLCQLFTNYSDPTCSICLSVMIEFDDLENGRQQTIKTLSCGHGFHRQCIDTWTELNNSCPICRNPIIQVEGNVAIPPEGNQAIPV